MWIGNKRHTYNTTIKLVIGLVLMVSMTYCTDTRKPKKIIPALSADSLATLSIPYQINQPDEIIPLPHFLEEISGLGFYSDDEIACVQDEEGIVVFYHLKQKNISDKIPFGDLGDYEGIESVNGIIYVLRNDGTLFQIQNIGTSKQETKKLKTKLNASYDTEGLTYDPEHERLLIACKAKAGEGSYFQNKKGVYAYDLKLQKFQKEPVFTIRKEDLYFFIHQHDLMDLAFYADDEMPFQPSGIAIHPATGHYYILSAENRMLLVLDQEYHIAFLTKLDKSIFPKPEGITFDSNGDLFISSEAGKGTQAIIARFSMLDSL